MVDKSAFEIGIPTYYESWPDELKAISIPTIEMALSVADIKGILGHNGEYSVPEYKEFPYPTRDIVQFFTRAYDSFQVGFFLKLGSRSPKDSRVFYDTKGKIEGREGAHKMLIGGSERFHEDLSVALALGYTPHLIARQWIEIRPQYEFRCFMKNRKLVGVSQYFYQDKFIEDGGDDERIFRGIVEFFEKKFLPVIHFDSVVFDIVLGLMDILLIEINPFHSRLTDPGLFNWEEIENYNDKTVYRVNRLCVDEMRR